MATYSDHYNTKHNLAKKTTSLQQIKRDKEAQSTQTNRKPAERCTIETSLLLLLD